MGMKTILKNIKFLVQAGEDIPEIKRGSQMSHLHVIQDAYLILQDKKVIDYGPMSSLSTQELDTLGLDTNCIDAEGRAVLPAFVDSHTHAVFAQYREEEFEQRLKGLSYEEIAAKGGGILNSAEKLGKCTEEELFEFAKIRIENMVSSGTGALEIKSGYGLTVEAELKMLRVIQRLKSVFSIPIKSTFLGAHAFPKKYKDNHSAYIRSITDEMLPQIEKEGLADFIDVFCEKNYFSVQEMEEIVLAGIKQGLRPKLHLNQFNCLGGIQKAVQLKALSVDHLEHVTNEDLLALKNSNTIPVFLPGCSHFLNIPYGDARLFIERGLPFALASDYNPGSSPNYDLFQILSLACIKMRLTPEEAINALTVNAAYAMDVSQSHGRIRKYASTPLIMTKKIPSLAYLPYSFGENHVERMLNL